MKEEWRDIPEYKGLYQVSNMGQVKSLRNNELILKPITVRKGYLSVNLYKAGKQKLSRLHRLVAVAFIPNPENKLEVNHKDGNKKNNCFTNLEWVTPSENQKHSFNTLHRKNSMWRGGIDIYTKDGKFIIRVDDTKTAVEWVKKNSNSRYKIVKQSINDACRGKCLFAYGYIFRYSQDKITS